MIRAAVCWVAAFLIAGVWMLLPASLATTTLAFVAMVLRVWGNVELMRLLRPRPAPFPWGICAVSVLAGCDVLVAVLLGTLCLRQVGWRGGVPGPFAGSAA